MSYPIGAIFCIQTQNFSGPPLILPSSSSLSWQAILTPCVEQEHILLCPSEWMGAYDIWHAVMSHLQLLVDKGAQTLWEWCIYKTFDEVQSVRKIQMIPALYRT